MPWGWRLQPLAAPREAGTTLRPGRCGLPGTPLSALDGNAGWGSGAGPWTCWFVSGTKRQHSTGEPQPTPLGMQVACLGQCPWSGPSEQKGGPPGRSSRSVMGPCFSQDRLPSGPLVPPVDRSGPGEKGGRGSGYSKAREPAVPAPPGPWPERYSAAGPGALPVG